VRVFRKYPFKERELTVDFNSVTREYSRYEEGIDHELGVDPEISVSGE
jgi:3',5'-cyclic-AMP phosphodiesterase